MTILGEVKNEMSNMKFKTSYTDFYSSMIRVPFFGENYNTIMPMFIIVFGIIFAILNALKLRNKALNAVKHY